MMDHFSKPSEALMREVARDLKPVRPSPRPVHLALRMVPLAVLVSSMVLLAMGPRPDSGTLGPLLTWGASAAQFALAIALVWIAAHEGMPAGRLPREIVYFTAVAAFLVNIREKQPGRWRRLLSQAALVSLATAVLVVAHSATSLACFILGACLMLTLRLGGLRSNASAVHALIIAVALLSGAVIVLGGQSVFFSAFGRDSNLTGRTDIWSTVIPMAINPVWGSGFESFWNTANERLRELPDGVGGQHPRGQACSTKTRQAARQSAPAAHPGPMLT